MHSDLPKVLHPLAGRALLSHVVDTARLLSPARLCVVVGHGSDEVRARLADDAIAWVVQERQLGTGHAVKQALPQLERRGTVLVLYGDVPLIASGTPALARRCRGFRARRAAHAGTRPAQGLRAHRARRHPAASWRIVEEKDATEAQRAIREVNTGIMALPARAPRKRGSTRLSNDNTQGEYYLTDVIAAAVADGVAVEVRHPAGAHECLGVNSKVGARRPSNATTR